MKRFNWLLSGSVVLCLAMVLLAGCGVSKSDYDALQAEKANLETELAAAQSDLSSLQGDYDALDANYQAASNELADLNAVYPPKEFASRSELEDWLQENEVSEESVTMYTEDWYGRALELQEDALADGYIVSVDSDYDAGTYYVWCTTVINGDIYFWDPETDDVYRDSVLTGVE
jgi:outer membrane murein-binding lipoprotein Lpp